MMRVALPTSADDTTPTPPTTTSSTAAPTPSVATESLVVRRALRRHDTPTEEVTPLSTGRDRATLSVLCGTSAGASFKLDRRTLIGRDDCATISIDDPAMSREHASIVRRADGRYLLKDLDSTNGTFVSGERVREAVLASGDRIQLGPNFVVHFAVVDELEEAMQMRLYDLATRDALTGVLNRRVLNDRLEVELAHARRTRSALSVLMIDVDEFKRVNDTHGHLAGDRVLVGIARCVQARLRAEDLLVRFGGEELVVVARTGLREAAILADHLRHAVEALDFVFDGARVSATVSIGVATLTELEGVGSGDALLARADARLYRAKLAGRNRTFSEG